MKTVVTLLFVFVVCALSQSPANGIYGLDFDARLVSGAQSTLPSQCVATGVCSFNVLIGARFDASLPDGVQIYRFFLSIDDNTEFWSVTSTEAQAVVTTIGIPNLASIVAQDTKKDHTARVSAFFFLSAPTPSTGGVFVDMFTAGTLFSRVYMVIEMLEHVFVLDTTGASGLSPPFPVLPSPLFSFYPPAEEFVQALYQMQFTGVCVGCTSGPVTGFPTSCTISSTDVVCPFDMLIFVDDPDNNGVVSVSDFNVRIRGEDDDSEWMAPTAGDPPLVVAISQVTTPAWKFVSQDATTVSFTFAVSAPIPANTPNSAFLSTDLNPTSLSFTVVVNGATFVTSSTPTFPIPTFLAHTLRFPINESQFVLDTRATCVLSAGATLPAECSAMDNTCPIRMQMYTRTAGSLPPTSIANISISIFGSATVAPVVVQDPTGAIVVVNPPNPTTYFLSTIPTGVNMFGASFLSRVSPIDEVPDTASYLKDLQDHTMWDFASVQYVFGFPSLMTCQILYSDASINNPRSVIPLPELVPVNPLPTDGSSVTYICQFVSVVAAGSLVCPSGGTCPMELIVTVHVDPSDGETVVFDSASIGLFKNTDPAFRAPLYARHKPLSTTAKRWKLSLFGSESNAGGNHDGDGDLNDARIEMYFISTAPPPARGLLVQRDLFASLPSEFSEVGIAVELNHNVFTITDTRAPTLPSFRRLYGVAPTGPPPGPPAPVPGCYSIDVQFPSVSTLNIDHVGALVCAAASTTEACRITIEMSLTSDFMGRGINLIVLCRWRGSVRLGCWDNFNPERGFATGPIPVQFALPLPIHSDGKHAGLVFDLIVDNTVFHVTLWMAADGVSQALSTVTHTYNPGPGGVPPVIMTSTRVQAHTIPLFDDLVHGSQCALHIRVDILPGNKHACVSLPWTFTAPFPPGQTLCPQVGSPTCTGSSMLDFIYYSGPSQPVVAIHTNDAGVTVTEVLTVSAVHIGTGILCDRGIVSCMRIVFGNPSNPSNIIVADRYANFLDPRTPGYSDRTEFHGAYVFLSVTDANLIAVANAVSESAPPIIIGTGAPISHLSDGPCVFTGTPDVVHVFPGVYELDVVLSYDSASLPARLSRSVCSSPKDSSDLSVPSDVCILHITVDMTADVVVDVVAPLPQQPASPRIPSLLRSPTECWDTTTEPAVTPEEERSRGPRNFRSLDTTASVDAITFSLATHTAMLTLTISVGNVPSAVPLDDGFSVITVVFPVYAYSRDTPMPLPTSLAHVIAGSVTIQGVQELTINPAGVPPTTTTPWNTVSTKVSFDYPRDPSLLVCSPPDVRRADTDDTACFEFPIVITSTPLGLSPPPKWACPVLPSAASPCKLAIQIQVPQVLPGDNRNVPDVYHYIVRVTNTDFPNKPVTYRVPMYLTANAQTVTTSCPISFASCLCLGTDPSFANCVLAWGDRYSYDIDVGTPSLPILPLSLASPVLPALGSMPFFTKSAEFTPPWPWSPSSIPMDTSSSVVATTGVCVPKKPIHAGPGVVCVQGSVRSASPLSSTIATGGLCSSTPVGSTCVLTLTATTEVPRDAHNPDEKLGGKGGRFVIRLSDNTNCVSTHIDPSVVCEDGYITTQITDAAGTVFSVVFSVPVDSSVVACGDIYTSLTETASARLVAQIRSTSSLPSPQLVFNEDPSDTLVNQLGACPASHCPFQYKYTGMLWDVSADIASTSPHVPSVCKYHATSPYITDGTLPRRCAVDMTVQFQGDVFEDNTNTALARIMAGVRSSRGPRQSVSIYISSREGCSVTVLNSAASCALVSDVSPYTSQLCITGDLQNTDPDNSTTEPISLCYKFTGVCAAFSGSLPVSVITESLLVFYDRYKPTGVLVARAPIVLPSPQVSVCASGINTDPDNLCEALVCDRCEPSCVSELDWGADANDAARETLITQMFPLATDPRRSVCGQTWKAVLQSTPTTRFMDMAKEYMINALDALDAGCTQPLLPDVRLAFSEAYTYTLGTGFLASFCPSVSPGDIPAYTGAVAWAKLLRSYRQGNTALRGGPCLCNDLSCVISCTVANNLVLSIPSDSLNDMARIVPCQDMPKCAVDFSMEIDMRSVLLQLRHSTRAPPLFVNMEVRSPVPGHHRHKPPKTEAEILALPKPGCEFAHSVTIECDDIRGELALVFPLPSQTFLAVVLKTNDITSLDPFDSKEDKCAAMWLQLLADMSDSPPSLATNGALILSKFRFYPHGDFMTTAELEKNLVMKATLDSTCFQTCNTDPWANRQCPPPLPDPTIPPPKNADGSLTCVQPKTVCITRHHGASLVSLEDDICEAQFSYTNLNPSTVYVSPGVPDNYIVLHPPPPMGVEHSILNTYTLVYVNSVLMDPVNGDATTLSPYHAIEDANRIVFDELARTPTETFVPGTNVPAFTVRWRCVDPDTPAAVWRIRCDSTQPSPGSESTPVGSVREILECSTGCGMSIPTYIHYCLPNTHITFVDEPRRCAENMCFFLQCPPDFSA